MDMKNYFVSLLIVLASFSLSTIYSFAHEGPAGHEENEAAETAITRNIIGNVVAEESNKIKLLCPVTGDWFVKSAKTPKSVYKEKTYYFCCPGCKPQFEKDPEKYVSKISKTP